MKAPATGRGRTISSVTLIVAAVVALVVIAVIANMFWFHPRSSSSGSDASSSSSELSKLNSDNNNARQEDPPHPGSIVKNKNKEPRQILAGATLRPRVTLHTTLGDLIFETRPDAAPKTVANFIKLAETGFFSDSDKPATMYRFEPNFCFQGGGWPVKSSPYGTIPHEYKLPNKDRAVSMARTSDPNSATSEFSIMLNDNSKWLGPGGSEKYGYAVFAQIVGEESEKTIALAEKEPREKRGGLTYLVRPIRILNATVSNREGYVFPN